MKKVSSNDLFASKEVLSYFGRGRKRTKTKWMEMSRIQNLFQFGGSSIFKTLSRKRAYLRGLVKPMDSWTYEIMRSRNGQFEWEKSSVVVGMAGPICKLR